MDGDTSYVVAREVPALHVHPSFIHAVIGFLSVTVIGTLWRLIAMHLVSRPDGTKANKFGRAMAVQY